MTTLTIYPDKDPAHPDVVTSDPAEITALLDKVGVHYERWKADAVLAPDASHADILAAYKTEIDRLSSAAGYQSVDVIRITPDNPNKDALRTKFLDEHTHDEDEVRFFVEGSGAFYLHLGDKVYQVVCTRDDLLSVPAGTLHWFDMGPEPFFTAVRLFISPDGWVANFTGDKISSSIPRFGEKVAA
ncbi:cupin [Kaistia dalseonensis]|uniref:Acireductone dioxygenase n=1 Tax=Kaistia dalseonensis TaxID=410840 RepID=A0ABU0HAR5_9HYPH|nr:cupin [Kaistia dalseonensis]MCX5496774.1 cupin [Kaistia dalseonensis]MDQ0439399.1 1,2-dihydroxy-3-keto-5-methylthiopentene dioxygenase [Kaistia dalseonensis]